MKNFKVGDRVVVVNVNTVINHSEITPNGILSGIVIEILTSLIKIQFSDNISLYFHVSEVELDVQWYREEKLNKIL